MISRNLSIHWFRQDLRISDNPALINAAELGEVLPVYIFDTVNSGKHSIGAAQKIWLHYSLEALDKSLGGKLLVYSGDPLDILLKLIAGSETNRVFWNRCYEPWQISRDKNIKAELNKKNIEVESYNGSLLWEPWEVLKQDGSPYKVFTPFFRRGCLSAKEPRLPLGVPVNFSINDSNLSGLAIDELNLLPNKKWEKKITKKWKIGENAAKLKVTDFIANGLRDYKDGRNYPSQKNVSRLSPHLHWGEVSPNQVWYSAVDSDPGLSRNTDHFLSELGWREFSNSLLYFFPDLPSKNLQSRFDNFEWIEDPKLLEAWQSGSTGFPIVDAGMRELWNTGYMHNRVRMIVGSFLVKNLRLDWRKGADWFWDCLVDADLANNSAGWQWIAGCGADAAPYFRVFNPILQGEKFDKEGHYTKTYLPELTNLPNKYLHAPWMAPELILEQAGIKLGKTYPKPIVDLKLSRERALEAFANLKN